MSEPIMVDLRTLVGVPRLDYPIKVRCPLHQDPGASLAVWADHSHCFGKCNRHFRRYESAALLLKLWDGRPETVEEAVKLVRPMLSSMHLAPRASATKEPPKPIDRSLADTFHRYLLASPETLCYFKEWRGLEERTIAEFNLGWTGTHFTIPVYTGTGGGSLYNIRYRQDPRLFSDDEGWKYTGVADRNERRLYSVRHLVGIEESGVCWLLEGEYDRATAWQLGLPAATITNGAGVLGDLPQRVRDAGLNPSKYVIAVDQDEAGEKAAWELQKQLGPLAVRARWDSNYKDISAFNVAGGGVQDIRLT